METTLISPAQTHANPTNKINNYQFFDGGVTLMKKTKPATTTAPEVHKIKQFNPENYEIIDYFDKHKPTMPPYEIAGSEAMLCFQQIMTAWKAEKVRLFGTRTDLTCDHCGQTNVMLVVAVDYTPTGERKCFGWQCAEEIGLTLDSYKRKRIEQIRKANFARLDNEIKKDIFKKSHPEIVEFIEAETQHITNNDFIFSMKCQLDTNGTLTEAQIVGVQKCIEGKKKFEVKKAEQAEKLKDAPPAPEGRQTVEGKILSVKAVQNQFNGEDYFKMLVELPDGNKVWGTVPNTLYRLVEGEVAGTTIRFTATFTRSDKDQHFSFAKRPAKVQLLENAPTQPIVV